MSAEVILNLIKLFLITQPPLQPLIKSHYEKLIQCKTIEEFFIFIFPIQADYFFTDDVPFEEKYEAVTCCLNALKPENIDNIVKLIEVNNSLFNNQTNGLSEEVKNQIIKMMDDFNQMRRKIEHQLNEDSKSIREFFRDYFEIALRYKNKFKSDCVIPINQLLEPITPPAEVTDKKIRLQLAQLHLLELLQLAPQKKLISVINKLNQFGWEETLDYEFDVSTFSWEMIQELLSVLCK